MFSMGMFGGLAMAAITLVASGPEPRAGPGPEAGSESMICAIAPSELRARFEGRHGAEDLRIAPGPNESCTLTVVLRRQAPNHPGCERTMLRAGPVSTDRIWLRLRVEAKGDEVLEVLELSRDGGDTWKPHSITRRPQAGFESGWL